MLGRALLIASIWRIEFCFVGCDAHFRLLPFMIARARTVVTGCRFAAVSGSWARTALGVEKVGIRSPSRLARRRGIYSRVRLRWHSRQTTEGGMGPDLCPSWRVLTGKTGQNRPPDQVFVSLSAPFFGLESRFKSSGYMTMRWWSSSAVASPSYPHPYPAGWATGTRHPTRYPVAAAWAGCRSVGHSRPGSLTRRQGGDLADRLDMPTGTGRRAVA